MAVLITTLFTFFLLKGETIMQTFQMFINGSWVNAESGRRFDSINPFDGEIYAQVPEAGEADADRAMAAAFSARKSWASTPPAERANVLFKAAGILQEQMQEFAGVLIAEGGSTFGKAMFELTATIDLLQTAAADSKNIMGETFHTDPTKLSISIRRPRGTVVAISPWNFPLILSMYKVAYALATGNTVVLKPASKTPVTGLKIAELFEKAGLPAGALNVITGPGSLLGKALISDARCSFVALTGETTTGHKVAELAAAGLKPYTLELGGKNPLVVLSDADIEYAVNAAAFGVFTHQGQICMAVGRIIAEEPVVDELITGLTKKAESLTVGDPSIPANAIGPLIDDEQVQKVDELVKDAVGKGATMHCGGTFEGRLYRPTVLSGVTPEMRIYNEETFGPVATIISVKDSEAAMQCANDTIYGLAAGVITQDIEKALCFAEGIEAGMVHVNNATIDAESSIPFGGCKGSGIGREGGRYSIEEMTEVKWVTIQKAKKQFPM